MNSLRQNLRRLLPAVVRQPLLRIETYLKRLAVWRRVTLHVAGVTGADKAAIRRSLFTAPFSAAVSLDTWCNPILLDDAQVDVRSVGRFNIRAQSDDLWHVVPTREAAVFDAIRSTLRPGDTFVDAGANIGFYTVLASKLVGPSGRVVAVEMMPDTAAILRHHVELNGLANVDVIEKALSDQAGEVVTAHVTDGKFGQATISNISEGRAVKVETTTLDLALTDVREIRLMKMDLEGVEGRVLRGAGDVLDRVHALIFECWTSETELADFLGTRGFSVRRLDARNHIATRLR